MAVWLIINLLLIEGEYEKDCKFNAFQGLMKFILSQTMRKIARLAEYNRKQFFQTHRQYKIHGDFSR